MVLPCTGDGPFGVPGLAFPAAGHRRFGDASSRWAGRMYLPCTSGVTAVYLGWPTGLRAGRTRLAPRGSAAAGGRQVRVSASGPGGPVTAGRRPPAASHGYRGTRMLADLYPRARTGDAMRASRRAGGAVPLPAASATGVLPEVHLRYTAGICRMVKARPAPFFSSPARLTVGIQRRCHFGTALLSSGEPECPVCGAGKLSFPSSGVWLCRGRAGAGRDAPIS
jgi:hypothetical protein